MAIRRARGGRSLTTWPPMRISPDVGLLEPGDHAEQRRLAAARGAEQDEELAFLGREVHAVDGVDLAEALTDVFRLDRCHRGTG